MPENRAELQRQWFLTAQRRLDDLIHEGRCLKEGNRISIGQAMRQLAALNDMMTWQWPVLPRGYTWVQNAKRPLGFHLRYDGREVTPEQFAIDLATGWLDELCDNVEEALNDKFPTRRAALPAPESEEGGNDNGDSA